MTTTGRQRDLACSYRGWVYSSDAEMPAATEAPGERQHVFLFLWKDADAELRCKNGTEENVE